MTGRSACACLDVDSAPAPTVDRSLRAITIYELPDGGWWVGPVFREVPAIEPVPMALSEAMLCLFFALDQMVTARAEAIAP